MSTTLNVDPADFNLLAEYNVLAVNGCSHPNHNRDSGVVLNVAPSDLLALVGQACAWCGGEGKLYCDGCGGHLCPDPICQDPDCPDPHWCPDECDGTTPVCPDCHGTGSKLLTVKTKCETCGGLGGYEVEANGETCRHGKCRTCGHGQPNFDAPNYGIRSLLVRLTGQPVPVVNHYKLDILGGHSFIFVSGTGPTGVHLWDGSSWHRIDLGPNPASLIGRWVWLPDALEVMR